MATNRLDRNNSVSPNNTQLPEDTSSNNRRYSIQNITNLSNSGRQITDIPATVTQRRLSECYNLQGGVNLPRNSFDPAKILAAKYFFKWRLVSVKKIRELKKNGNSIKGNLSHPGGQSENERSRNDISVSISPNLSRCPEPPPRSTSRGETENNIGGDPERQDSEQIDAVPRLNIKIILGIIISLVIITLIVITIMVVLTGQNQDPIRQNDNSTDIGVKI